MNVGIFYSRYPKTEAGEGEGYLYTDHPQWRNYPHELLAEIAQLAGGKAVIVCKEETYQGDNSFERHWVPDPSRMGFFTAVEHPITLDAIFDKGHFRQAASFSRVNIPALATLGRDKAAQYDLFKAWQPTSVTVENAADFDTAIAAMPSELVVVKPPDLNGGRGVIIEAKHKLKGSFDSLQSKKIIVQQYIDSSKGVAGISDSVHDLRLYIINGVVVFASVRTPKEGSLVANTSQGGSIAFYGVERIPEAPIKIAGEIDTVMKAYGNRYYSADFVTDGDRWYLIEINDRPGVPAQFQSPAVKEFHQRLARCIVESTDNPLNQANQ